MSDSEEASQQPTPPKTPKRPQPPERTDSEQSIEDPGYQSGRSRSQSRRRRRQNQRQRTQQQQQQQQGQKQDGAGGHGAQTATMDKIDEEEDAEAETQAQSTAMLPFERIGPDSTSMNGPVTHARAMRGEIPMNDGNSNQALATAPDKSVDAKAGGKDMMQEDGLKLRLELNLDIEIELKASIHGDLTLALLDSDNDDRA